MLAIVAMVTAGAHQLGALAEPERSQSAPADDPANRAVAESSAAAGAQAYGSSLIGWQVVTDTEAAVGPVRDLIYDLGDGAVAYLVVTVGSGPAQALVLPYTLGAVDPSGRRFIVSAQATAHLGAAPRFGLAAVQTTAFDPTDAPAQWARPAERYWYAPTGVMTQLRQGRGRPMTSRRGLTPYGGVRIARATLFSHSALAGRRLQPGNETGGGTLSDTIVDRNTRALRYVAVTMDAGRVLALPIEVLSVATERETVAFGRIASLDGAPGDLVLGDSRHLADVSWPEIERYWSQNIPGLGLRGALVVDRFHVRASTLAELAVYPDFGGLSLGQLDDLVIGAAGRIEYVVLATDEPLGSSGRRVLIPMSFLALGQSFEHALADVTAEEIDDLPALPAGVFPATARIGWDTDYRRYWGAPDRAVAATTTGQQPFLVSSLVGANVTRPDGALLAVVDDLIVDLQAGVARYALLAPVDVAVASGDATDAVVPIDLIVLTIGSDGTPQPVAELTPTRLLAAPRFDVDDPGWERRARTYWRK